MMSIIRVEISLHIKELLRVGLMLVDTIQGPYFASIKEL